MRFASTVGLFSLLALSPACSDSGLGLPEAAGGSAGSSAAGTGMVPGTGGAPVVGTGGSAVNSGGSAATGGAPVILPEVPYYVAPGGSDAAVGSQAEPFATLAPAVARAQPGVVIWIEPGTYQWTAPVKIDPARSGSDGNPIVVKPTSGRPVFDFSLQERNQSGLRGIELNGNYWHIQGVEIKSASDNCIAISGAHNVIENVILHECGDTGLQITAPSSVATDDSRAAYNTILNCDSWGNIDAQNGGENADGFAAKLAIGAGNVFRGCRAWNNADDGWDLFAANDVVVIDHSWAFSNGKPFNGQNPQGDGNGFKLGGKPSADPWEGGAVHLVTNSFGFENKSCGFVRNNNPEEPSVTACGGKDNKTSFCSLVHTGDVTMTMSAEAARTAARAANGELPPMN